MSNLKNDAGLFLWPSVILLLGLIMTGAVWRYASLKDDEASSMKFNLHMHDAARDVQRHIEVYFGVLHSAGGFFAGSESVTRAEFERFVSFLRIKENYPGIEGMGVIRYIPDGQKKAFENAISRENGQNPAGNANDSTHLSYVNYTIHPPGARKIYYPVEHFWPPSANISLPGLDHGAYPSGLNALQKARDTGLMTMSTRLPYAQGTDHTPPPFFSCFRFTAMAGPLRRSMSGGKRSGGLSMQG